ncbi:hypothetical protein BN874_1890002 [Candidatus Contendobacter odensis Run_B_J11]|uniref:Uncharacterized protein n=1 Tax=Candidatus Contendobacter odensis Run_B_J11 TaxID=1400861 RepID=A0A7U7J281_9GAMM|nr:hypothetical protein BN874_1890002 [Candidatus Contendobacter odensis Run_B_J11]
MREHASEAGGELVLSGKQCLDDRPFANYSMLNRNGSIHFYHEPRGQSCTAQAGNSQGYFAVVLSRRQNWRTGAEWLWQINPATNYGRGGC